MRLLLIWLMFLPLQAEPSVTLVPLDDRPCNLLFVHQLGRIGGARVESPPRYLLHPGQPERVALWLAGRKADFTLVSVDMLCYGGLVEARQAGTSLETARRRLRALDGRSGPTTALAILPRLSLRTSEREAPYERALARWATRPDAPAPSDIPPEVVAEYLSVRQRNLELLGDLLGRLEQGKIERLVVGQDDSAPTGLHRLEADRLLAEVARRGLQDRFVFLSGADELSMDLVSGYLADRSGVHPVVRVVYSDPSAAGRIPPLESFPLDAMVRAHLQLAGARLDGPAEVTLMVRVPDDATPVEPFLDQLRQRLARGERVALADLALVNRMEPALARGLLTDVPLPRLEALAGWNTAANGLGTAAAQLVCHRLAARQHGWPVARALESEKTQQAFLLARLLDDYGYQAVVRPAGLGDSTALEIRASLVEWGREVFASRFLGRVVELESLGRRARIDGLGLEVVLPWQRAFEVEVRADVRLKYPL